MKADRLRHEYFEKNAQIIVFDSEGRVIQSSDTLVDISSFRGSLYKAIPFLEGMQEVLSGIDPAGPALHFHCVDAALFGRSGYYDFVIQAMVEQGEHYIGWLIFDFTAHYEQVRQLQQQRNTSSIKYELLELEQQNIRLRNELLEFRNAELLRIQEFKNQFFSKISHEIRNPLQGISGLISVLKDSDDPEERRRNLEYLESLSDHLARLVNDVLDLSSIESGKIILQDVPFSVPGVVEAVATSLRPLCRDKPVRIVSDISPEVPRELGGDPARLTQVLFNLVGNSIKFTESGEVGIHVAVTARRKDRIILCIEVRDTGIGMDAGQLRKVFRPYEQGANDTFRWYGGTGLGLTIVKQLVELQKGSIRIKSQPFSGTVIRIKLPFRLAKKESKIARHDVGIPFRCILVADDNSINRQVLIAWLGKYDCRVEEAATGGEVLSQLTVGDFDLLLLDYYMDVEGIDLIRKIRNLEGAGRHVNIIIVSAESEITLHERLSGLNVLACVRKPVNAETLSRVLQHPGEKIRASSDDPVRLEKLRELLAASPGKVEQIIEIFSVDVPKQLDRMRTLIQKRNWKDLKSVIHKLKPSYGYLGLTELTDVLTLWEDDIVNKRNAQTFPQILEQVEERTRQVITNLKSVRQ